MIELGDDELLALIGEVLAADEPISGAVAAAVEDAAASSRRLDAELAELRFDTALEGAVAVRGDEGSRSLSFAAADHELDVELAPDGTMVGRVAPPGAAVVVEGPAGVTAVDADRLGRFTAATPPGRVRFLLGSDASVVTPWVFVGAGSARGGDG